MSKSKRAYCVVFTATMLALASQAGAVGQATTAAGVALDGAQAKATPQTDAIPATARRAARRAARAQSAVVAIPDIDTSMAPETTSDAEERIHKGHVVGSAGNGRLEPMTATSESVADARKGHVVGHGGNGRQEALAAVNEPAAGVRKGHVVGNAGNAKQAKSQTAVDPACATKIQDGRPTSCPKGITQSGIK